MRPDKTLALYLPAVPLVFLREKKWKVPSRSNFTHQGLRVGIWDRTHNPSGGVGKGVRT